MEELPIKEQNTQLTDIKDLLKSKKIAPVKPPFVKLETEKEIAASKSIPVSKPPSEVFTSSTSMKLPTSSDSKQDKASILAKIKEIKAKIEAERGENKAKSERTSIKRESIVKDTIKALKTANLLKKVSINFKNEPGTDCGGLARDWISTFFEDIINPERGLFIRAKTTEVDYLISPFIALNDANLLYFESIGKMMAKTVIQNVNVGLRFSKFIYLQLFGTEVSGEDMQFIDSETLKSLMNIKPEELKEASLTYTTSFMRLNKNIEVELFPGGRDMTVTSVFSYCAAYVNFLNTRNKPFISAIQKGIFSVLNKEHFQSLSIDELKFLFEGEDQIDINDWRKHTSYSGYAPNETTIKVFWRELERLNQVERGKFLKYTIGLSRTPIGGFK